MRLLLAIVFMAGMVVPAFADDLVPAPWRGEPRTTFAMWEFNDNNPMPPEPDQWDNPIGPPVLTVTPKEGEDWLQDYEGMPGVWPLSGEIWVEIWNFPEPLMWKDIWIQLTWAPMEPGSEPFIEILPPDGTVANHRIVEEMPLPYLPDIWTHTTYHGQIFPNPEFETIHIWGDIYVSELVIETRCIPEPATLGLLSLGSLALLRRKRK